MYVDDVYVCTNTNNKRFIVASRLVDQYLMQAQQNFQTLICHRFAPIRSGPPKCAGGGRAHIQKLCNLIVIFAGG